MAYTPKDNYDGVSFVTAEDFNGLKELLNNECNRRRGVGSVQSYAGSAYQFSTKPAPGGYILAEHGQKLADPLRAINPAGIDKVESGSYIRMDAMAKRIAELGKKDAVSMTDTGCAASCTGLCSSGCYTTCNGCTPMSKAVENMLDNLGVPREMLHFDDFGGWRFIKTFPTGWKKSWVNGGIICLPR